MTNSEKNEKLLLVNSLSRVDLEIVSTASSIFNRVFSVASIKNRTEILDRNVYISVKRLETKGIFSISKELNKQLRISFTEKGRSICDLVKEKMKIPVHEDFMEPSLF